jgi:HK97 gp10 family phage protein
MAGVSGVTGMADLLKSFKDLTSLAERNKTIAIKLVANQYKNDVQAGAPYLTGTLRRSIHVEMVDSSSALVGTDLPYAKRQEYGFMDKDKLGRVYHQKAHPYFRPPMENNQEQYQRMYLEALGRV